MLKSKAYPRGRVAMRLMRKSAPLRWKLRNILSAPFLFGLLSNLMARTFSALTGIPTITAELSLILRRADGMSIDYGVVSRRVVTNAGVAFLVDDWDNNATDITNMNYHGVGTGTNSEDVTDTALQTESTTILNPDSTRATGVKSQPSANILQSVGSISFDGSGAITEHGLFSQAATGGGVLWDRHVFSAINVISGDSIQATYQCTINAGG